MSHLKPQFPRFSEEYDGYLFRLFIRQLEDLLGRVRVDTDAVPYAVTADHTVMVDDDVILCDTTAVSLTITLPAVQQWMIDHQKEYTVKKVAAGNRADVVGSIDGATGVSIYNKNTSLTFRATSDGWKIV